MRTMLRKCGLPIALSFLALSATGQDWSSCASDLDGLKKRASNASNEAEEADSKHRAMKSAEDDFKQCVQFPQTFDLRRDHCNSLRSDYNSAKSDYAQQLDSLRSGMDDVDSKIRSISSSCGVNLQKAMGPPPTVPAGLTKPDQCSIYLRYKGRLPAQSLIDVCSKQMPADQCRKCLE